MVEETTIFRQSYRALTEDEKSLMSQIKETAQELYELFPKTDDGRAKDRETSLAVTKLEESVMWAVKSITK
jgi:hypothetical protein